MKVHKGVTGLYYFKFGMDPHVDPTGPYNPIKLAAQWLLSVERYLLTGEAVLVNSNGGLMPRIGAIVLGEVESDKLIWPDHYEDEVLTISRWPERRHYYLCSNKGRIFVPDKHNTFEDAHKAALAARIAQVEGGFIAVYHALCLVLQPWPRVRLPVHR